MENEKTSIETVDGVKLLINQLQNVSYGVNAIQQFNLGNYGSGQAGFDLLKNDFNKLDLSESLEYTDLNKKLLRQKKEVKDLEKKYTNLTEIIGENTEGREGSIASQILINLNKEIEQLTIKRDSLLSEIIVKEDLEEQIITNHKRKELEQSNTFKDKTIELEELFKEKEKSLNKTFNENIADINLKTSTATDNSNKKIREAEINAIGKVKLINQFRDFLEETNKNMNLYNNVIIGILIAAIGAICFSIPNLLNIFDSYDTFIKGYGNKITNWHIINYAFGLLIVKLPWALCLSAVLTGMYSLLKGLLLTYEKINQDKRNMSAIYAISGNVAQALNEYGIDLAEEGIEDDETGEIFTHIKVSKKELVQKKENIRWNQIMKYFEGMQQNKVEFNQPEDPSKLKLVSDLLNKLIEKLPKT